MEDKTPTVWKRVPISSQAYAQLRTLAKQPQFCGRGGVGVLDQLLLGHFTTSGSGSHNRKKKSQETGL